MKRYIDLSHTIDPANAGRKFEVKMIGADEVNPLVIRMENQWYIMHDIAMVSHIATHIEAPYHILKNGADLSEIPLSTLCGACVMLDLKHFDKASPITPEALKTAAEKAGGISKGDILLCNLGYAKYYGKPEYSQSPYFTPEAIRWIVESKVKMLGVDSGGVEVPRSEEHVNHIALLAAGIPLIENVANLDAVGQNRFELFAFPVAIKGLESFPLRVVAAIDE